MRWRVFGAVLKFFEAAELRLGEKSTGQTQNLIGLAELFNLPFQCFDAITRLVAHARRLPHIPPGEFDSIIECRGTTANLRRFGLHRRSKRRKIPPMLLHHPNGALQDFRRKLVTGLVVDRLVHGLHSPKS